MEMREKRKQNEVGIMQFWRKIWMNKRNKDSKCKTTQTKALSQSHKGT